MSYELKEYLNSINHRKDNLMDTEDEMWEKKYPSFIVNKCLAPFPDTIGLVNEINLYHHLDNKLQFDFLLNSIRPRKRYTPWMKAKKVRISSIDLSRLCIAKLMEKHLDRIEATWKVICFPTSPTFSCRIVMTCFV